MTDTKNNDSAPTRSCCSSNANEDNSHSAAHSHSHNKRDYILWGSVLILTVTIGAQAITGAHGYLHHFTHASLQILHSMWWGIALGIIIIGLMSKMPREIFTAMMGKDNGVGGLMRAIFGGLFLDLCCHGILLVAAKLYERGVSLGQVVAFLVASPWNSLSLTLVLIGLIGLKWTLAYIIGSMVIAFITGMILQAMTRAEKLPPNPNKTDLKEDYNLKKEFVSLFKSMKINKKNTYEVLKTGFVEGKMIIKWLLFGTIIAASLRTFVPSDMFAEWLGPNVMGLFITLVVATIVEICSEGSAPIASEIVTGAHAPGNGFTFLMAGVATDYTEFMAVREFTGSWKVAIAIPLITVPQVLLIGYLMNLAGQ